MNTYALIGHMSLRIEAMGGDTQRAATDREAAQMQARLQEALAQGASGFSTGLYYPPNMMAPTDEVIAVAEALRATGGIYVTHMRDEANDVLLSIEETLKIGKAVNVPVVISHHKCSMPENFGRSVETLPMIDAAAGAQKVDFDVYPYAAGSTVLMPHRLRKDVPVQITWSVPHPELAGRMLADIAADLELEPKAAAERLVPAGAIYLPDGGAGRAAHHGAPAGDDRQRRPAARTPTRIRASGAPSRACSGTTPATSGCSAWKTRCAR